MAYLTHNLIEAVELGALAHVVVDGEWDDDLMTQVQAPAPIPELSLPGVLGLLLGIRGQPRYHFTRFWSYW